MVFFVFMLTKQILTLLTLLVCFSISAQESRQLINGKISNASKTLSEVHIINLNTGFGVISDDMGAFSIGVKAKDVLLISSLQYINQRITIKESDLTQELITILLIPEVNMLDEVFLHGLSGSLTVDIFNVPKDTIPKHNFVYKKSDLKKILPPDTKGPLGSPDAQLMTDPIKMNGVGGAVALPDKQYQEFKRKKLELNRKKAFPNKIRTELGNDFFLVLLKIPEDRINHFISYCEHRELVELYEKNKILEIIKIFRAESINYLAIEE